MHLNFVWDLGCCENRGANGKRPALGDKADLFQEKGDKSITLDEFKAITMPTYFKSIFFKKTEHWGGFVSRLQSMPGFIAVQFFVLPGPA